MIEHYTWFALRTKPQQEGIAQAVLTGHVEKVECPKRKRPYGAGPVQPRPVRIPAPHPRPMLEGNGVVVLIPVEEVFRKANGTVKKKRKVTRPLMRGWVLAGFADRNVDWWSVLAVDAVTGVAGAEQPLPIRHRQMLGLLRGTNHGVIPSPDHAALMRSRAEYQVGDLCEIASGPFEGQVVDVRRIHGRMARVLMRCLGGSAPADIPLDNLVKVA